MSVKYIIHKGKFGFADRLRLLSSCIDYSSKFDRTVLVDWNDPEFTSDFNIFFYFDGIKWSHDTSLISNGLDEASIFPDSWSGKLSTYVHYHPGFGNTLELSKDYPHDVLVFDEGWLQWFPEVLVNSLRLRDIIKAPLKNIISQWGEYYGYHIRLSDQVKSQYKFNADEAAANYSKHFDEELVKFDVFLNNSDLPVFLATDNSAIRLIYKNNPKVLMQGAELDKFLEYQKLNPLMGVHHVNGKSFGVDKTILNRETLIDFFLLVFSKGVTVSRGNFARTAEALRTTTGVEKILSD